VSEKDDARGELNDHLPDLRRNRRKKTKKKKLFPVMWKEKTSTFEKKNLATVEVYFFNTTFLLI